MYVDLVHGLAEATIKTSRFHRQSDLGIHSRSDLALDAVADLFERDSHDQFPHLKRYFSSQDWESLSDRELWTINRKLVSGAVADSYFRNYRLADPSLARIIRNTKRGVLQSGHLSLVRETGTHYVCLPNSRSGSGIEWDIALMTAHLIPAARESMNTPDLLRRVSDVLSTESPYSNSIRLSVLALAIRECSVILNGSETILKSDALLTTDEINRAVDKALNEALEGKKDFYISKRKLKSTEFEGLRDAIEMRLKNEAGVSDSGETNYEAFQHFFPETSNVEYREHYRNAFEYLYRLTYAAFCTVIQDWVGESAA